MLLSMTGFGDARHQDQAWSIEVEVRTVNNRHLKLSTRISEPYSALEADLEHLVRQRIRRGAVQLSLRVDRPRRAEDYRLNLVALASYREQLRGIAGVAQGKGAPGVEVPLGDLLALPGVVEESRGPACDPQQDWPAIARVVGEALDKLEGARAREGDAMAAELTAMARSAEGLLGRIADRAPLVVQAYQGRLTERIGGLVRDHGVSIDARDLIREVAILADRSDISEEIVRLRAHLAQFQEILGERESAGRKLEFVVQEMGREANTIGSKASDVEISRHVFEIKGILERIRELIQNVE
ncbi:YicC/YloC family endoribonuclease [Aquisphaera insulae]|uniref:YicC/YloC family endoribonuclease n=1 Tax=Aquisphaera insulae TaxID=2712864 RepID=UPI0013EAEF8A|nr:YicC/YloC family endoribonuclease [Aquisphaera insulae]